jgi:hypothetical protein
MNWNLYAIFMSPQNDEPCYNLAKLGIFYTPILESWEFLPFRCNSHRESHNINYIWKEWWTPPKFGLCCVLWVSWFVICLSTILVPICIKHLLFFIIHIDFTFNSSCLLVWHLEIFTPSFFVGVKECTLSLHFIARLKIDMFENRCHLINLGV